MRKGKRCAKKYQALSILLVLLLAVKVPKPSPCAACSAGQVFGRCRRAGPFPRGCAGRVCGSPAPRCSLTAIVPNFGQHRGLVGSLTSGRLPGARQPWAGRCAGLGGALRSSFPRLDLVARGVGDPHLQSATAYLSLYFARSAACMQSWNH